MRNQSLPKFILRIAFFIILLFIVDRIIGDVFVSIKDYGLKVNPENRGLKEPFIIEKVDAEVLIIGSSKASRHYVASLLSDSLGISVYNCGQDGCFFLYQNCILNMVLDRYHPKMILWDIQPNLFDGSTDNAKEYQNVRNFSPYYHEGNQWVVSYVKSQSKNTWMKMQSEMFGYNSKLLNYLFPLFSSSSKETFGYIPLPNYGYSFPKLEKDAIVEHYVRATDKLDLLSSTIERCNTLGIQLKLFISPEYRIKSEAYQSEARDIKKVASSLGVDCYDYSSFPLFMNDSTLFKDVSHLNDKGARLYTNLVLSKIKD